MYGFEERMSHNLAAKGFYKQKPFGTNHFMVHLENILPCIESNGVAGISHLFEPCLIFEQFKGPLVQLPI